MAERASVISTAAINGWPMLLAASTVIAFGVVLVILRIVRKKGGAS